MERSILQQLNFTDNLIDRYIEKRALILLNENLYINNSSLAINVFLRSIKEDSSLAKIVIKSTLDNNIRNYLVFIYFLYYGNLNNLDNLLSMIDIKYLDNESKKWFNIYCCIFKDGVNNLRFPYEESIYLKGYIILLKKYIKDKEYGFASELVTRILKIEENIQFEILRNVLDKLEDKVKYIVDDGEKVDPATHDGIRQIERRAYVSLDINDISDFIQNMNLLKMIWPSLAVKNICLLIIQLDKFIKNKNYISSHEFRDCLGFTDEIIMELLNNHDFYRISTIVKEEKSKDPHSIRVKFYDKLINKIMFFNKRNIDYAMLKTEASITSDNYESVLKNKNLNSINISFIKEENTDVDFSYNYYELYLEYRKKHKYDDARRCLNQFEKNMNFMGIKCEIDYLIKELEIDTINDTMSEREKDIVKSLYDKLTYSSSLIEKIAIYQEILKYDKIKNPSTLVNIAKCYKSMGEYDTALHYIEEAMKYYLYPEDYILLMEILLHRHEYHNVIDYAYKYQFYKNDENGYVYYMMSIAYVNMGEYDKARDCIIEIKNISLLYNNVEYDLSMELKTIDLLKKGEKNVKMYDIGDFIDFTLNFDELKIKEMLENNIDNPLDVINKKMKSDDLKNKLAYIMSVLKVCNYLNMDNFVEDIIEFAYHLLESNTNIEYKDSIQKKLSIYRTNFLQKKL